MAGPPPPPPGFTIDAPAAAAAPPPPPPGFKLDAPSDLKPTLPEQSTGNGFMADAIGSFGAGFNKFVNPILRAPERLVAKGADLAASAGIPVPRSMTSEGLQHVYEAQDQGGPMGTQVAPNSTGRWSEAAGNAVGQGLAMSAIPAFGAEEALATAAPRIAQGGASGAIEALQRGAQQLMARPGTLGGTLANVESNAVSGATGQAVAEGAGEKYRTAGELVGGAAPAFFPSSLLATALGKVLGKPSKIAASMLPESPTFDLRKAEREAYINRETSPSGVDYSGNAPDPSKKMGLVESIKNPAAKAKEIATTAQDAATGIRRENAQSLIAQQFERAMQEASTRQAMETSNAAQEAIPGFKPTLAESLNDPELLLKQQEFERGMSGPELIKRQQAKDANTAAISKYGDSRVAPAAHALPGEAADETVGRTARDITASQDAAAAMPQAQAEQGVRDLGKSLPNVPAQDTGRQIRAGYEQGAKAANDVTEAKKQAIFDEAGGTRFSSQNLNAGLKQDMERLGTDLLPEDMPPAVRKVLGRTETPAGGPTTGQEALLPKSAPEAPMFSAEDLFAARKQVNEQLQGLTSGRVTTTDGAKIQRLQALKSRLDAEWKNLGGEGSDVGSKVSDFNKHYGEEVVPNYRQGLGEDITSRKPNGEPGIADNQITNKLTSPNAVAENEQNLRVNPTGPAREATKTANLDAMRQEVVDPKTGMIREGGVKAFIAKNRDRLAVDPEMKGLLASKDPDSHYKLMQIADQERQAIKEGPLNEQFGGPRSDTRAIDDAVADPQKMRALKNEAAKNPDLDAALKRAVWERAIANPTEAVKDPKQTLNILYGDNPQHLRDLKTISDAVEINARSPRAKGEPTSFKPPITGVLQDLTGSSASSTLNKLWGLNTGRTSKSYLGIDTATRIVNRMTEADYNRALKEAIFNPEVAKVLAASVKNGGPTPMMRDKLGALIKQTPDKTRAPSQSLLRTGAGATGKSDEGDK